MTGGADAQPLAHDAILAAVGDGVYQLDATGRFVAVNDTVVEVTGYDRERLLGEHVSLVLPDGEIERIAEDIRALLTDDDEVVRTSELAVETADGETLPCELRFAVLREDGEFVGTVGVVRDVSERERRERTLVAQRDELERLRRVNAVIRSIDRAVVRANTPEEVETAVVERLAAADPYLYAVVGRFDASFESFHVRAWAGVENEHLARLRSDRDLTDSPGAEAVRKNAIQVVQDIERSDYPWQDLAIDCGYRSLTAVPLANNETVYGVLGVYADRPFAFDERERNVLEELGDMVGYALSSVRSRRALGTERVVELKFRFDDDDHFFTALSAHEECVVTFEDAVQHGDGLLLYVSVRETDPASAVETAKGYPSVEAVRVVSEGETESLLEVVYDNSTAYGTLTDYGAVVRRAVSEDGESRVNIDLPETENVREVRDALIRTFDGAELVSQRSVERPAETRHGFRDTLDDRLTERQRTVLEATYRSGYFEWPRASTGEVVADSLDIAAPTLHKHLRRAEAKVLDTVFELDG